VTVATTHDRLVETCRDYIARIVAGLSEHGEEAAQHA